MTFYHSKFRNCKTVTRDFPDGSMVRNPLANAGDLGLIPGSGRSPGGGNGNPLQHSCLKNTLEEPGEPQQTVRLQELDRTEGLNTHTHKAMTNLRCVARGESCFQNPKRAVAIEKGHPQEAVPFMKHHSYCPLLVQ